MAEQSPQPENQQQDQPVPQPLQEQGVVSAVALKIPPFWPADPAVWFAQVEAQFSTKGVVQQRTRFDHVVAALAPDVITEVRDVILHPPADRPYDRLKEALIQRTEASEQRRLQQLLTAEELGDRKPSQLLRHMQHLLGDSGPTPDSAFVRQLFLQRLPPSVRMVLASSSADLSLPQLAEMADRILEVSHVPTVAPVTDPNVSEMRQLTTTLTRLVAALDATLSHSREPSDSRRQSRPSRSPSRPPSRQQSRSSSPAGLCWYHRRFGTNARKCRPPCMHSGNDQASR